MSFKIHFVLTFSFLKMRLRMESFALPFSLFYSGQLKGLKQSPLHVTLSSRIGLEEANYHLSESVSLELDLPCGRV